MAVSGEHGAATRSGRRPTARLTNVVLGAWLFVSAFLWAHSPEQQTNTWVVGALCVAFALAAVALPWARHLNTLLAIWLFVSTWAMPADRLGTLWNNALVAIAIFLVSLAANDQSPVEALGPRHASRAA
jgi:hypothetical protein